MIFNIVSGGFNIRDNNKLVSLESNALTITNLAFSVLYLCILLPHLFNIKKIIKSTDMVEVPIFGKMTKWSFFVLLSIVILNIGYSVVVMEYYKTNKSIDKMLYDFSISMVTVNTVGIVIKPVMNMMRMMRMK